MAKNKSKTGMTRSTDLQGSEEPKLEADSPEKVKADVPEKEVEAEAEETPTPSPADETPEPRLSSDGEGSLPTKKPVEDYLRQYQYRKDTVLGSPQSDPQPGSKAERMKKALLKQPRVRIIVPRPQGEKNIEHSVTLNGYRLDFPKNQYLDLPQQIADVIMNAQQQTEAAIARGQIAGDARKESEFNR